MSTSFPALGVPRVRHFLLIPIVLAATTAHADPPRVLKCRAYVNEAGALVRDGTIVIENDRIVSVSGDAPEGATVESYEQGVACPGLIDLDSQLTAAGQLSEAASAIEAQAFAADAFNAFAPRIQEALRAGVTTCVLAADDRMLIGGRSAVYATSGPNGGPVLRGPGPLKLSLSPVALRESYEPSSRAGAIALLRRTVEQARAKQDDPSPLAEFARGELPGFAAAPFEADVLSLAEWADREKLKLVAFHNADAARIAEASEPLMAVVVGPLGPNTNPRFARSAGLLEKAGRKVAIAGTLPFAPADSLRIGAAVAARHGLSAEAARRAITSVPAELLGMHAAIGSIQPGKIADLVIFSGDPIDLRSRVLAVFVGGTCVYRAPEDDEPGDSE